MTDTVSFPIAIPHSLTTDAKPRELTGSASNLNISKPETLRICLLDPQPDAAAVKRRLCITCKRNRTDITDQESRLATLAAVPRLAIPPNANFDAGISRPRPTTSTRITCIELPLRMNSRRTWVSTPGVTASRTQSAI